MCGRANAVVCVHGAICMAEDRRPYCSNRRLRHTVAAGAAALTCLLAIPAAAVEDEKVTIEGLLKGGWQIAGYTSTLDERSAFILFKHPSETYLVQCRAGYDVTRTPRVFSNCYELH
jgi:hypothetical protein